MINITIQSSRVHSVKELISISFKLELLLSHVLYLCIKVFD